MKRMILGVAVMVGISAQFAFGGGRVMSVYLESIAAMQGQLFQAAQVFDAPELGTAPMMMSMMIPGYALVDRDASIGVHIYAGDAGEYGFVLELTPLGSAEALLETLLASQGISLPEPVDGRYVTDQGVAQVYDTRLLIGKDVSVLDIALAAGIPAGMPGVPGMIRMQVAPQQLAALFDHLDQMMKQALAEEPEHAEMMQQVMGMYRTLFAQMASYELGIGVREHGLEVRSRVIPVPDRALARIMQSLQGVKPAWVESLAQDNILGVVTGAYEMPEDMLRGLVALYVTWMQSLPGDFSLEPDLVQAMFEPTIETAGAPSFMQASMTDGGAFRFSSGMLVDNAAGVLAQMMEVMGSDAYRCSMEMSGITMSQEPVTRMVDDVAVHRWNMEVNEEVFLRKMEEASGAEVGPDQLALAKKIMEPFLSGYDYAATAHGVVFGITDDVGISRAIALLGADAAADAAASRTLLDRVDAPVVPYAVARIDVLALYRLVRAFGVEALPAIARQGEGIVFAAWRQGPGVEQVIQIPASDIQAIRQALNSMTP